MTDRELLELAALAAGIKIDKSPYNGGGLRNTGFDVDGYAVLDWHNGKRWNPLKDDGDALRLAVKLNLKIECMVGQSAARTFNNIFAGCVDHSKCQQYPKRDFTPDPYAATRRAIVRAAAEAGRAQKETPKN